ncbi:MAG: hypothetical protein V1925_00675 [Candidatus Omnitrophota bacterium]
MKNKFSRVIFVNLAVILAGCFLNSGSASAATKAERYQELTGTPEEEGFSAAPDPDILRPAVEYRAEDLQDPFQKPSLGTKGEVSGWERPSDELEKSAAQFISTLQLQGIILGGRFPQAIINNSVVKVGDTIGEARIINITKAGVSLFLRNRTYNLSSPASGGARPLKRD